MGPHAPTQNSKIARSRWVLFGLTLLSVSFSEVAQADYSPPEAGYDYGEILSPRTLAMGGASRVSGLSTSAIYGNPANLALQKAYHVEALGTLAPMFGRLDYGVGIADSMTNRIAAGVFLLNSTLGSSSDPYQRERHDARASIAYPFSDAFSIGVTGKWLQLSQNGDGPLGYSYVSPRTGDGKNISLFSFDIGLTAVIAQNFRLSAVTHNPIYAQTSLLPMMFAGGLGYVSTSGELSIEANFVVVDPSTWGDWKFRAQVGGEYLIGQIIPVRLGYSYDDGSQRHSLSGGLGYVSKSFAVDAGVRAEIVNSGPTTWDRGITVSASIRVFLESMFSSAPPPTQ